MAALRRLQPGQFAILGVVVIGSLLMVTRDPWGWLRAGGDPQTTEVEAPTIAVEEVDEETQRLYRISPNNGSEVRYVVTERLAGTEKTTVGTTTVVGGDILFDLEDPSASTIGEVVVNVEMFTSDSNLRDKRLRHDFLASTHFPFARFEPTSVEGLPTSFADGDTASLTLTGNLTVKETTNEVVFVGEATITDGRILASVSTSILGSAFDVGPINIARLAHTDDEITLEFDLVADRIDLDTTDSGSLESDIPADEIAGGAFAEHVMPVLQANCVGCHRSGGPGWSTLALDTAGDAAAIADDIALVTGVGYMPPWLPSKESPDFLNDWSLTDDELGILAEWAANGGGLDVAPDTPLVSTARSSIRSDVTS